MSTPSLHPPAFRPLPLGAVKPAGWLRGQLRIQAAGLSGHLDEFWPDIRDSQWFGGDAEAWERAPYWLDGVIPLAYLLEDAELKAKVERYMDFIITHQHDDGWLGPRRMIAASGQQVRPQYDLWAQLLATKVVWQYYVASGDERVITTLERAFDAIDHHIDRAPLFNWGQFRWFEALLALFWLYERSGEPWLFHLAVKLRAQGFDWGAFFRAPGGWPAAAPTPAGRWNYMSHVVNNAMAPKGPALTWRMTGDEEELEAARAMVDKLDQYHGMVTGMFTGDECLAGRRPTHGTELCAVVEYAFSLENLISILGDAAFGDRLERVVFNALPATFSPDMWAHQYDQQVNQEECSRRDDRIWNTNGPDSNLFGVEPNYGCCTANFSQGWPKFAAHLWMMAEGGTQDDPPGLAAVAYAPSTVRTTVKDVPVTAALTTDYPFREALHFTVTTERPVEFSLWLRVPSWADGAALDVDGEPSSGLTPGTFAKVERRWEGTTSLKLQLPMQTSLRRGARHAAAIVRGPLVYALKMGERWECLNEDIPGGGYPARAGACADWEVYPTTPWNYALDVDEASLEQDIAFEERPIGDRPFSPEGAPMTATVYGRRLPAWGMDRGSAADAPTSPVTSNEDLEALTLIPYGCTNLRITEFPTLARE
ncbi:MAG: beta-L-arabinofuranosidase domain-containing protein [Anaerolineae bacterium]